VNDALGGRSCAVIGSQAQLTRRVRGPVSRGIANVPNIAPSGLAAWRLAAWWGAFAFAGTRAQ